MSQEMEEVWSSLRQAGLVQGSAPETEKLESPWYVKTILAFSGWLAAILILIFIGIGFQFIMQSSMTSFITGSLMIAAAYALLRIARNDFFEHLALAISFAGQVLIVIAILGEGADREIMPWLGIVLIQLLLAVLMPNFVHRACSSYFAVLAFSMVLTLQGVPYLFSAIVMSIITWLWLNEFHFPPHMQKIRACGYGAVLALIQFKGSALFGPGNTMGWNFMRKQPEIWGPLWLGEAFACLVMLTLVWQLLQRSGRSINDRFSIIVLLGTLLLCAVSMQAQGITVGVMILLLGFSASNRILMGLGIVSLLFYISSYYYLLETTLLVKAQILFMTGLLLLSLRWILLHVILREKEVQDAE